MWFAYLENSGNQCHERDYQRCKAKDILIEVIEAGHRAGLAQIKSLQTSPILLTMIGGEWIFRIVFIL